MRPVWAEIDLDALEYNVKNIKNLIKDKDMIAVVKADAYGHGALDIIPTLIKSGVNRLAVAVITEAIEFRKNNINMPIMILGNTDVECLEELINYDIEQTVFSYEYAKELSKVAEKLGKIAKIHIALDTGMGRIGFLQNNQSINEVFKICKLSNVDVIGIFTHFSTADEKDKEYSIYQFEQFKYFVNELEKRGVKIPIKHCSNSGAIMDLPETYLDSVRAGIILYGYYPSNEVKKEVLNLKPVLSLKAKISNVKELDKDMYVSYGRTYKTVNKTKIATIPIGYADGYSRLLSGKGKVIVNGKLASVVGRVCMDQCMIDVTECGEVKVSDEVILLGSFEENKFDADNFAEIIGTINYEILCMIKERVPRVYVKNHEIVNVRNYI